MNFFLTKKKHSKLFSNIKLKKICFIISKTNLIKQIVMCAILLKLILIQICILFKIICFQKQLNFNLFNFFISSSKICDLIFENMY